MQYLLNGRLIYGLLEIKTEFLSFILNLIGIVFQDNKFFFLLIVILSNFLDKKNPAGINIYVTDGYSIENDIVNRSTCNRLLCEVFNFATLPKELIDDIINLFEEQLSIFYELNVQTMAWILHWKRSGEKPYLNNIEMKHLFTCSCGKISLKRNPKGKNDVSEYIHTQCNIPYDRTINISLVEKELRKSGKSLQLIRGKYLLWFLIEFALSVNKDICKIFSDIKSPPKVRVSISQSNGVVFIAPRARIPESLKLFLDSTCCLYIQKLENKY